jgi:hypothetical protein
VVLFIIDYSTDTTYVKYSLSHVPPPEPYKNSISETFKFRAGNSIFVPKHYGNTGFLNPLTPSVVNFGSKNPRDFIYVKNILYIHFPAGPYILKLVALKNNHGTIDGMVLSIIIMV